MSVSYWTPHERDGLGLVAEGKGNAQPAEVLGLATSTVRNDVHALYVQVGVTSRAAAFPGSTPST